MREPRKPALTSQDVVVGAVGRDLYEKFFENYTRKHWGLDPSQPFVGRLAQYRYYNMEQVVAAALKATRDILHQTP